MFIRTENKLLNTEQLVAIQANLSPEPCIVFTLKVLKRGKVTVTRNYQSWETACQVFEELHQAIERGALLFDIRR